MDFRNAAVSSIAQRADQRNHVQTKFAVWQGPFPLLLGPIGPMIPLARLIAASADTQGEPTTPLQRGNGSPGAVRHRYRVPTEATAGTLAGQLLLCRCRSATFFSCHQ